MSCTDELTSEETLTSLHDEKCKQMSSDELMNYLMDSMPYLKTEDLQGWKRKFTPENVPVVKRRRMAPSAVTFTPMDPCTECGSEEVLDDTRNGQYVCLTCGLIQQLAVFTGDIAHCSWDRIKNGNRVYIHRYSRVVHFRSVISQLTGNSRPVISTETKSRMQVALDGRPPTEENVIEMIRRIGLSRRYRRHAVSLTRILGGTPRKEGEIPADVVLRMYKMFTRVEFHFNRLKKRICPKRKVFFSYKFLLYQFLRELGCSQWARPQYLLKCKRLLSKQCDMYRLICKETGYDFFM
jgi:hypothetical protein